MGRSHGASVNPTTDCDTTRVPLRHILRLAVIALLTVFFLAIFLWKSDLHRVAELLGAISPGWLALAIASNFGALLFRAIRWRYILDSAKPPRLYATLSSTAI